MEIFFEFETYIALLTLTIIEIILGIDNIIFISIITNKDRTLDATALTEVETIGIERSVVLRELQKNSELVQLATLVLLKRLEIMNHLKLNRGRS